MIVDTYHWHKRNMKITWWAKVSQSDGKTVIWHHSPDEVKCRHNRNVVSNWWAKLATTPQYLVNHCGGLTSIWLVTGSPNCRQRSNTTIIFESTANWQFLSSQSSCITWWAIVVGTNSMWLVTDEQRCNMTITWCAMIATKPKINNKWWSTAHPLYDINYLVSQYDDTATWAQYNN